MWRVLLSATGVGLGIFMLWAAIIIFLPAIWPTEEAKRERKDAKKTIWAAAVEAVKEPFCKGDNGIGFIAKNLLLGSPTVEKLRREAAFIAFLERACERFLKNHPEPADDNPDTDAQPHPATDLYKLLAQNVQTELQNSGIITKEHILCLHDAGDSILEDVLSMKQKAAFFQGQAAVDGEVVLDMQPSKSADDSAHSTLHTLQQHDNPGESEFDVPVAGSSRSRDQFAKVTVQVNADTSLTELSGIKSGSSCEDPWVKALARAIKIEATRPLKRTQDPQVLLCGVSTLITLNVFLASAVFIGLSITSPDGVQMSLETAYCDLSERLVDMTDMIAGNITASPRQPLWGHVGGNRNQPVQPRSTQEKSAQANAPPQLMRECSAVGRAFPKVKCPGDDTKKPLLMMQQITAFVLFVGSTGVAFGLLLSLQPDGELNEAWERCVTWMPYICFSGVSMLLGLFFLIWSLVTMGEVQYGAWETWAECTPWLSRLPTCLVAYQVFGALVGISTFFNGWKIV